MAVQAKLSPNSEITRQGRQESKR